MPLKNLRTTGTCSEYAPAIAFTTDNFEVTEELANIQTRFIGKRKNRMRGKKRKGEKRNGENTSPTPNVVTRHDSDLTLA